MLRDRWMIVQLAGIVVALVGWPAAFALPAAAISPAIGVLSAIWISAAIVPWIRRRVTRA
jgi:hypothetical protein